MPGDGDGGGVRERLPTDLCERFARQMYFAAISMQIAFKNKTELV